MESMMPHMNEVFELLETSKNLLVSFSNHLVDFGFAYDDSLEETIEKLEQILHEWEILKTGNLARS